VFEEDPGDESFEETLRSIATELGKSVEHLIENANLDELADGIGVEPGVAREWVDTAGSWLRARVESLGGEMAFRVTGQQRAGAGADALRGAAAHPLDLPTEEQGLALAALDSGRWMLEPGTHALASSGDGPGPDDALGIVRELRVRDWITADGEITLSGRHALSRWLDAAPPR
jgi:hypothetical protein